MDGDLASVKEIKTFTDPYFSDNVTESVAHAWYDGAATKHPYEDETVPKYTKWDDNGKYSWVKAPRFGGKVMQVGPLAQVLVGFALKHEPTVRWAVEDARDGGLHREDEALAGDPARRRSAATRPA